MDLFLWKKDLRAPKRNSLENSRQVDNQIQVESRPANQRCVLRQVRLFLQHHEQFARNVVKTIEYWVQEVETNRVVKLQKPLAQPFQEHTAERYVNTQSVLVDVGLVFAFAALVDDFSEAFALIQTQKVLDRVTDPAFVVQAHEHVLQQIGVGKHIFFQQVNALLVL